MKKLFALLLMVLLCATSVAQTVTLVFTGRDVNNNYVKLDRVEIYNRSKGWQDTIHYPDTVLPMESTTGIVEFVGAPAFGLSQNTPNPFNGTTDVLLTVAETNEVTLEVMDASGRTVAVTKVVPKENCVQKFRINLSSPGMYFLSARQKGNVSSVKMVNNSVGSGNTIDLIETRFQPMTVLLRSTTSEPFEYGDDMEFIGYSGEEGEGVESQHNTGQVHEGEEDVTLLFPYISDGQPCQDAATVTDVEGNVYNTVKIGTQCWMKENLRTTVLNGMMIEMGEEASSTSAYRYAPNGDEDNVSTYGYLYNWSAVMLGEVGSDGNPSGVQGICPTGWHVPSSSEWIQLTDYLSSQNNYWCGNNGADIAKSLSARNLWSNNENDCAVGNGLGDNNSTGFSALPAGDYDGSYHNLGLAASFWTATPDMTGTSMEDVANIRTLVYNSSIVINSMNLVSNAASVRCVKNEGSEPSTATLPTVTTSSVTDITDNSALCGGNVTDDGGVTVTARGICWSTSQNPDLTDNVTTDGNGTGEFTSAISGLSETTTYYVRAYATNVVGTAYGEEVSFTTTAIPVIATLPTVVTSAVEDITTNSASCVATVTDDGGASVTSRGVCWSDSSNPTIADSHTSNGDGIGDYTGFLTELEPSTEYFVRAYATNVVGTAYGEEVSFTTTAIPVIATLPTVVTSAVEDITTNSATCVATVTDDGGASVTSRGVCWSDSSNPTIADSHTSNGDGIGDYTGFLTELEPSTEYFVRAYATNSEGTAYGSEIVFTTLAPATLPTVVTIDVNSVTTNSASCLANVTADGGAAVTARGVCWSTSQNPTISDAHTTNGTGTGNFTGSITDLEANTLYYVRAYATNSVGTAYGETKDFVTEEATGEIPPCPNKPIATDYENNVYSTILMGDQCWMRENLKTTHYANGESIPIVGSSSSATNPYCYFPGSYSQNKDTYGLLYNWSAMMHSTSSSSTGSSGVQGICPDGWHVPSSSEWDEMTNYVNGRTEYRCGGTSTYIAKALAYTEGWTVSTASCVPGNDQSSNNSTGFGARPAGSFATSCSALGGYAYFWTSSYSGNYAINRAFNTNAWDVSSGMVQKTQGYSVRCVFDVPGNQATTPTLMTAPATNVTATSSTCSCEILSDGGAAITVSGFCWGTSSSPTTEGSHTTNGTSTGSFTSVLSGLAPGITYYVRAYATNSEGTAYSNQISFSTPNPNDGQPCTGAATVTDADNNTYNTVMIGNQCWMKENLRTTKYADGTVIVNFDNTSSSEAYWYYPNGVAANKSTYGLLYNWKAVMGDEASSTTNPSGVQGICPAGWHVPSVLEWSQLTDYVGAQSQYRCGDDAANIAKALASSSGWSTSESSACSASDNPATNNSTGFSAMAAGELSYGSFQSFGTIANYWTSAESGTYTVNTWYLYYLSTNVYTGTSVMKEAAQSVRCLRD